MINDPIKRLPTGINGFDQVALGGLPAGRSTLVAGTTGSGKTLFAVEFLARGIQHFDQPGVFVTFEETADDIRRNFTSSGFDIGRWEAEGKWAFIDASLRAHDDSPVVGTYDLGALVARIEHAVRQVGAKRVSLDSLDAVFSRFKDIAVMRHELFRIATRLEAFGVTSVITAERVEEYDSVSRYGVEEFVLDNVIILRNVLRQERRRRTVEVVKLRGAPHRNGEWLFTIDPQDGMVIIPLAFLVRRETASRVRVSTGNVRLDQMLGGGLYKDSITLMIGPTGTGKTLSGLSFADEAFRRGERCLLYSFDETREQLSRNALGWGYNLEALQASGSLKVLADYPEVASLEDHFLRLRHEIDGFRPARLVVDPLSALERILPPRMLLDFVIALGALLRQHEITTFLTLAPTGRVTPVATPTIATEIASLTDVMIVLRYVERTGEVLRCISVLQTRGSDHDHAIRRVTIDSTGMHIGEPMTEISQILPATANPASLPQPRLGSTSRRRGPGGVRAVGNVLRRMTNGPGAKPAAETQFGSEVSQAILCAAADGIVAVDHKGIIRICNPAAEKLFSRQAGELVGTPFGYPITAGGATEIDLVLPGGQHDVVEMRVTTTTVGGARLQVAALRDVTRRRQEEQELQVALERQNVMVAVAAHEFGNPLTAISVLVYTLQDSQLALTEKERADIVYRIGERTTYLQALVRKLRVAARIDSATAPRPSAQVPFLELTLERVADLDEQARLVQVSCTPGLAVLADRGELSEMLANYLDNAISYGRPPVEVVAGERDGQVEIRVCDRGPGVPDAFVPHLFDRFTREPGVEQKTEGTGLGLWIVRSLARANGGDAWHEPNKAGGACFCLRLPQAPCQQLRTR